MDSAPNNSKLKEQVLAKIRGGKIAMHSRLYYMLKMAATLVVALCVLVVSIFILSFIFFSIRESSENMLINFGPPGWLIFLQLFPWWLLALDVALIALLQWMVHAFRLAYRIPLLYLWGGLFGLVLVVSLLTDVTHVSDDVLLGAQQHKLPGLGQLYDHGMHPPPPGSGACPCIVDSIEGDTLMVHEDENGAAPTPAEMTVVLPPGVSTSSIQIGEHLFIMGRYQDGVLHAQGLEQQDHDADDH